MDTRNGNIYTKDDLDRMHIDPDEFRKHFIEVDESEMTPKQKQNRNVSPFDNRSRLGKKAVKARKYYSGSNYTPPKKKRK